MVTIKFELDEEKILNEGKTKDEIENRIRTFYKNVNVPEVDYLVFERDDKDSMAEIGLFIWEIKNDSILRKSLKQCVWYIDGTKEDVLDSIKEYEEKYENRNWRRSRVHG